jgi:hypothetical protein
MDRLGWTAHDLYVATLEYGDVGSSHDVQEHLRTGDHLSPAKKAYVAAALWDAEIEVVGAPDTGDAPEHVEVADAPRSPRRLARLWERLSRLRSGR